MWPSPARNSSSSSCCCSAMLPTSGYSCSHGELISRTMFIPRVIEVTSLPSTFSMPSRTFARAAFGTARRSESTYRARWPGSASS